MKALNKGYVILSAIIAVSAALTACGKSGDSNAPAAQPGGAPPVPPPATVAPSIGQLQNGTYSSGCRADRLRLKTKVPSGYDSVPIRSNRRISVLTIQGNTFQVEETYFSGSNCNSEYALFKVQSHGHFEISTATQSAYNWSYPDWWTQNSQFNQGYLNSGWYWHSYWYSSSGSSSWGQSSGSGSYYGGTPPVAGNPNQVYPTANPYAPGYAQQPNTLQFQIVRRVIDGAISFYLLDSHLVECFQTHLVGGTSEWSYGQEYQIQAGASGVFDFGYSTQSNWVPFWGSAWGQAGCEAFAVQGNALHFFARESASGSYSYNWRAGWYLQEYWTRQ